MKQIRLKECEFGVRFPCNSVKDYRYFEILISTSCFSIRSNIAISRLFIYPKYFPTRKLEIHSLFKTKKNHSISSQNFCPCIMTTIASSHSSNLLPVDLFHFSYSAQSSLFHYSNWPLLRQFLLGLKNLLLFPDNTHSIEIPS
jgi:hypothetical protein